MRAVLSKVHGSMSVDSHIRRASPADTDQYIPGRGDISQLALYLLVRPALRDLRRLEGKWIVNRSNKITLRALSPLFRKLAFLLG